MLAFCSYASLALKLPDITSNYLQRMSEQKVFTKVIKNSKPKAWLEGPRGLLKERVKHYCLKRELQNFFH